MNLLLDTHIILWWLNDDEKLSGKHRKLISRPKNNCYISSATIWEISIKAALGKLEISSSYRAELEEEGFLELPVNWQHAEAVRNLPLIHKDPFDRLLIVQAQIEGLCLLTADDQIQKYDIKTE